MIIQGVGAIVNLILDPILIFGAFGLPRMEVAGAAVATGIGQLVGMLIGIGWWPANPLGSGLPAWLPTLRCYCGDTRIGLPAIMMQSLFTIMTLGMNKILALFSDNGVFIMGAYFKVQSFLFMPVFGLNNGLTPVVSYNYGAKRPDRIGAPSISLF